MSHSFAPRFLVPMAVGIAFAVLRKYVPPPRMEELPKDFSIAELSVRFRSTQWNIGLALLLMGAVFAWVTHALLVSLNLWFAAREGPAYFQLLPSSTIWWFFPGFGALTMCWGIAISIWMLFASRETVATYIVWTNVRSGFDTTKALRWMALLVALPIGILTLLAVPMHTTLHANEMRIREYASMSSLKYDYGDARRIAVISGFRDRDGKFTSRATVIIEFADGRRWSSAANRDFEREIDQGLVQFLAGKIHLPVEQADTANDLRPPLKE